MTIKVSVIVPVYNVENYLSKCLDSILNQTLKDMEIICINDGSKDSSKEILEAYQKEDDRIFIVNKANGGYGAACNIGLKLARGKYISIIEPDDFIDSKMFEDLYKLAEENNADIVKSAFYEYKDGSNGEAECADKVNWSKEYEMPQGVFNINDCTQLVYFHPSIWSCIYKKEFLNKNCISFVEPKGAGWADNPFQVQTLCLAERILYTDNAYYYYRLTNPSSSSNIINISNPFDRSDEIHSFIKSQNISNPNFLAHLYKREFGYIRNVLTGITDELFVFASKKISDMIMRMKKEVIYESKFINSYERNFYEQCQSHSGIFSLMEQFKKENNSISVVQTA